MQFVGQLKGNKKGFSVLLVDFSQFFHIDSSDARRFAQIF